MTQLFNDPVVGEGMTSDLAQAPSSSIGLADQAPAAPAPDLGATAAPGAGLSTPERNPIKDAYSKMSRAEEIFTRIGEFGAGVTGQPSPLQGRIESKRRDQLMKIAELKETTSALEHGVTLAQGLEGDARAKFVNTYAGTLDGLDKGLGDTFKAVADRPDVVKNIQALMPYLPEPLQLQARMDPKAFLKTIGTGEGIKAIDHAKNQYNLRTATNKAQMILSHAQQFGIPEELIKEYQANPTASVFAKMERTATDPRVKFTPDEQTAVSGNADIFYGPLGMMTPKGEESIREDKAKKGTKSAHEIATEGQTQAHQTETERQGREKIRLEKERLDQEKFSAPLEVSVDGKNTMVRQDKKSGKLFDPNGTDVTDKIAPQIKGSPLDPGRVSMLLQAHKDITDARAAIFDEKGELNRSVIAAMDVPGTKGVGTEGRKAYSAIENAVAAKLRGETGAATNPGEIENTAARFRPTLMDTKESAKYKLDRLQEFMGMTLDQLKESYHISQDTYDKAKGGSRGDRGGEPLPMPASQSELVPNQDYTTSRGVATWDGTKFVPKAKKK